MGGRDRRARRSPPPRQKGLSRRLGPVPLWLVLGLVFAVGLIVAVAAANSQSGTGVASRLRYDVGKPGVGNSAPDFELPNVTGATFRLSNQRGKTVLLYFHEGLGCAPCWQQVGDLQQSVARFKTLGIDEIVPISVDPVTAQAQRAQTRGITLPVLADESKRVSSQYDALSYGMMGGSLPGHTFILVGPDGVIRWRADYGGPPDFTMYVPVETLMTELGRALAKPR